MKKYTFILILFFAGIAQAQTQDTIQPKLRAYGKAKVESKACTMVGMGFFVAAASSQEQDSRKYLTIIGVGMAGIGFVIDLISDIKLRDK